MPKTSSDETIAKITARQAIIVTMITVMGGVSGAAINAYVNRPPIKPDESQASHYLTISSVQYNGHYSEGVIRLTIEVNGHSYSYPSKAVWTQVGPTMGSEAFRLPETDKEYEIRIHGFYRNTPDESGQVTGYINEQQHIVPISALPISREYPLHSLNSQMMRGVENPILIRYDIR